MALGVSSDGTQGNPTYLASHQTLSCAAHACQHLWVWCGFNVGFGVRMLSTVVWAWCGLGVGLVWVGCGFILGAGWVSSGLGLGFVWVWFCLLYTFDGADEQRGLISSGGWCGTWT